MPALGGAGRDRTGDLKLAKLALSQLSYGPNQATARKLDLPQRQTGRRLAPARCSRDPIGRDTRTAIPPTGGSVRSSLAVRRRQQATGILRKEVIQPQVPLRLPCYDFTPVADLTVAGCLLAVGAPSSGQTNSHGVTGGVYKARERIHRGMLIHDY